MPCSLSEYFEQIFIINLDLRKERLEKALQNLSEISITNINRFSAINGREVNYSGKLTPGEIGCLFSHLSIIKYSRDNNFKNIFIFEDDVEFSPGANLIIEKALNELPEDWFIFYLGGFSTLPISKYSNNLNKVNGTLAAHAYGINGKYFNEIIKEVESDINRQIDVHYYVMQKRLNAYITNPKTAFQFAGFSDIKGFHVNYSKILHG